MMKRIGLFLILLVLLGTIHVKAQYTVSYQYTKIVEANGIIKKGNPQSIYYFTFNQQVMNQTSMETLLEWDKSMPIFMLEDREIR